MVAGLRYERTGRRRSRNLCSARDLSTGTARENSRKQRLVGRGSMADDDERHVVVTGGGRGIGGRSRSGSRPRARRSRLLARDPERLAGSRRARRGAAACDIRDRPQVDRLRGCARPTRPIHALVANAGVGGANRRPGRPLRRPRRDEPHRHVLLPACGGATWRRPTAATSSSSPRSWRASGSPGTRATAPRRPGCSGWSARAASSPENVQVNAICPGWVVTDMAWQGIDGFAEAIGPRATRLTGRCAGAARADERAGGHRRLGRVAAVNGRARRHGPGDRYEQWRLDGMRRPGHGVVVNVTDPPPLRLGGRRVGVSRARDGVGFRSIAGILLSRSTTSSAGVTGRSPRPSSLNLLCFGLGAPFAAALVEQFGVRG